MEAKNGDFGKKSEPFAGMHEVPGLLDMFKRHGVDGVFVATANQHKRCFMKVSGGHLGLKQAPMTAMTPNTLAAHTLKSKRTTPLQLSTSMWISTR